MDKLKWCIKRTPENADEVNEWANKRNHNLGGKSKVWLYSEMVHPLTATDIVKWKSKDFHEITIDEFRLLTDPEKYFEYSLRKTSGSGTTKYYTYETFTMGYKQGEGLVSHFPEVSEPVFNELQRMWKEKQSHYSDSPEVTTTLDPLVEYKTSGPDGTWSFDFEKPTKKASIKKLNKAIKAQKKALKQLKELRKKLNAEVNY